MLPSLSATRRVLLRSDGAAAALESSFAVTPDLRETENLSTLSTAGDDGAVFSGGERLKREWTVWLLAALLGEAVLAWFCGRAW